MSYDAVVQEHSLVAQYNLLALGTHRGELLRLLSGVVLLNLLTKLLQVTHECSTTLDRAGMARLIQCPFLSGKGAFTVKVLLLECPLNLLAHTLLLLLEMRELGLNTGTNVCVESELPLAGDVCRDLVVHELVHDIFRELESDETGGRTSGFARQHTWRGVSGVNTFSSCWGVDWEDPMKATEDEQGGREKELWVSWEQRSGTVLEAESDGQPGDARRFGVSDSLRH